MCLRSRREVAIQVSGTKIVDRWSAWNSRGRPLIEPPHPQGRPAGDGESLICPSQPSGLGSIVIGLVGADGLLRRVSARADSEVLSTAGIDEVRYAGQCLENQCSYWAGSCQLAGAIVHPMDRPESLEPCVVRGRCRWFLEHGPASCGTCSQVTYLMRAPERDTD